MTPKSPEELLDELEYGEDDYGSPICLIGQREMERLIVSFTEAVINEVVPPKCPVAEKGSKEWTVAVREGHTLCRSQTLANWETLKSKLSKQQIWRKTA